MLTHSEIALSKVLGSWRVWPGASKTVRSEADDLMLAIGDRLIEICLVDEEYRFTEKGRALLDCARKAGVVL